VWLGKWGGFPTYPVILLVILGNCGLGKWGISPLTKDWVVDLVFVLPWWWTKSPLGEPPKQQNATIDNEKQHKTIITL
jgi:hypothetical protein